MFMIYLILVFIVYFSILILGILLFLLLRKWVINLYSVKKKQYYEFMYPKLRISFTHGEKNIFRLLSPKEKWKREIIIQILLDISSVQKSDERVAIEGICKKVGLIDELERKLNDSRWWIVLEAITIVGKLKLMVLDPYLLKYLYSPVYELWIASARALSQMNKSEHVLQMLIERENSLQKWSIIRISDILVQYGDDHIDLMIKSLDHVSLHLQCLLIEILGKKRVLKALPIIEEYLSHDDQVIRLKSLKAIGDIGYTNIPDKVGKFLTSENWEERLNAIHVVRNCGIQANVPHLSNLLSDLNWWVRLRAAESLFSLGAKGKQELIWASQFHQDRFARDMANKILQNNADKEFSF